MSIAANISWHKECLANKKRSLEQIKEELLNLQKQVEREQQECVFYKNQISEAEKEHKDKFDRNKYLISKVKK